MTDSDDSSASSGDDMLNMVVPFSQESPGKSAGSGNKGKQQNEATSSDKKRKHEEIASDAKKMEEKALAHARRAFNIAFHDSKVGSPHKLFWLESSKKGKKVIDPVRVVPLEETVGVHLNKAKKWDSEKACPIQFVGNKNPAAGKLDVVSKSRLSPYNGDGDDGGRWCPVKFEQYSRQLKRSNKANELDLKTEQSFLQCLLQKSLEEGEEEKKLAEVDEAVPEEIALAHNDGVSLELDSDDDNRAGGSKRSIRLTTGVQERREPLRKGDVIEFYKQQSVAGDPSALIRATVLAVDPKGENPLILDDPMILLEPHHKVKRIQRYWRGKLVDYDGHLRSITNYHLRKEGDTRALSVALANDQARVDEIVKRTNAVGAAKMKEAGVYLEGVLRTR